MFAVSYEEEAPESDVSPSFTIGADAEQPPGAVLALQCEYLADLLPRLDDAGLVDLIVSVDRMRHWADGLRARVVAAFADRHPAGTSAPPPGGTVPSPVSRWLPDELGLALRQSRQHAQALIAQSHRLAHVLPDTLDALQAGLIDERRADAISYATATLPDEKAREVEAAVLPKAADATLRQVQDRARRAVHRIDPDGEHRRHRSARQDRRVTVSPREEGMASLWILTSGPEAEASFTMLTRLAHDLGPEDPRPLDQRRSDLATQLLQGRLTLTDLGDLRAEVDGVAPAESASSDAAARQTREAGTALGSASQVVEGVETGAEDSRSVHEGAIGADEGTADSTRPVETTHEPAPDADNADPPANGPDDELIHAVAAVLARRPQVHDTARKPLIQVVVGLDTLRGTDDRPAELAGHGPITADTARALAADSVWKRLVTDPLSGMLLEHGRSTYRPPPALADHVLARDQTCRFPTCTRRARDGDLDHLTRWADGGDTDEPNLHAFCPHHHWLKEHQDWHVLAHPDGRLTWITPTGRRYTSEPFDYRPFTDPMPVQPDAAQPTATAPDDDDDDDLPPF